MVVIKYFKIDKKIFIRLVVHRILLQEAGKI